MIAVSADPPFHLSPIVLPHPSSRSCTTKLISFVNILRAITVGELITVEMPTVVTSDSEDCDNNDEHDEHKSAPPSTAAITMSTPNIDHTDTLDAKARRLAIPRPIMFSGLLVMCFLAKSPTGRSVC